jgi:hypothetical protein
MRFLSYATVILLGFTCAACNSSTGYVYGQNPSAGESNLNADSTLQRQQASGYFPTAGAPSVPPTTQP